MELNNGRQLIDMGSYAVPLFGHRPAAVADEVRATLDRLPVTTRLVANPVAAAYLRELSNYVNRADLTRVWLGLNGTDAVEAALKFAVAATRVPSILAVKGGYHGKSLFSLAATWDPARKEPVRGVLPDARHIDVAANAVARALDERPAAALIFEPLQAEGGGHLIPAEVMRQWVADAHDRGTFVIADEIQCGFHRCGPVSLALEAGADVDAVLLGKPLGGGVMPLSAVVTTDRLWGDMATDPYLHTATFSAHPLSCAAGRAALQLAVTTCEERSIAEQRLSRLVADVAEQCDVVQRAEAHGLFAVFDVGTAEQAGAVVTHAARAGLLVAPCTTSPTSIRLLPSLTTTPEQWHRAQSIMCRALGRAARIRPATAA
ncbi:putrescine aminotransferase [Flexivirga oryzae]|uniref:Putrescine aminotransferase n=1 Tax=Flexivirga oryzae TaxID=1794944 RepID=A0A839N6H7_9MICO|nr:putrescine aminotransferase [Flexivirga oryzae]